MERTWKGYGKVAGGNRLLREKSQEIEEIIYEKGFFVLYVFFIFKRL